MSKIKTFGLVALLYLVSLSGSVVLGQTYEDALRPFWTIKGFGAALLSVDQNAMIGRDLATISANPANLGLIRSPRAYLSMQYAMLNLESRLQSNSNFNTLTENYLRYNGFAFIYPADTYQGNLVFALSYEPAAQYAQVYEDKGLVTTGNQSVFINQRLNESGSMNVLKFASAVEFRENLFLGFALNFFNGTRRYDYIGIDTDTTDIYTYQRFWRQETIRPEYRGTNLDFGLAYQSDVFKFGLRLSTPLKLNVKEASSITNRELMDNGLDSTLATYYNLEYKTRYPLEVGTQLAFTLANITLSFDVSIHNWSEIEFSSDLVDENDQPIDNRINNNLSWKLRPTTDFGVGLTIPLLKNLSTQLGYRIIPRPYYELADDEKYISWMGIGLESQLEENLILGLSYLMGTGARTIYNSYFDLNSRQQFKEHQFTLSTAVLF
jgi:hypothetical protein